MLINFAVCGGCCPGVRVIPEKRFIEIPMGKELEQPKVVNYFERLEEAMPHQERVTVYRKGKKTELPAVCFNLPGHCPTKFTMKLLWIREIEDWVAVIHLAWKEKGEPFDEIELGPYALDDYCKRMLAIAYGMSTDSGIPNPEKLHK